jgi:hypothetical protein
MKIISFSMNSAPDFELLRLYVSELSARAIPFNLIKEPNIKRLSLSWDEVKFPYLAEDLSKNEALRYNSFS